MATLALIGFIVYFGLAFGVRSLVQRRRTGSTGFKGISGAPGSPEWLGGVAFVLAIALALAAPLLALAGIAEPLDALDGRVGYVTGGVVFAAGLAATLLAQAAMGASWRIGVDERETTALVTDGPFALVRNPIFAAMIPTGLGLALLCPSAVAVAGFVALIVALELQTRRVEEPYLLRAQGTAYADYAARVGRFVPGVGRLR
jgi:protein-S-isoprenylcysteine O-methyltransferase Ste14